MDERIINTESRPAFSPILVLALIVVLGLGILVLRNQSIRSAPEAEVPLPVISEVPAFSLTERDGRTTTNASLAGKPWVANFVFTTCPGPCPKLSARMNAIQREILNRKLPARLVSFSVDPLHDTPAVLQEYAARFKADSDVWWFLTCNDEPKMYELIGKGFLQTVVAESDESPLMHSNYMVVVDAQGRLRSFHDGLEAGVTDRVVRDLQRLAAESPGA